MTTFIFLLFLTPVLAYEAQDFISSNNLFAASLYKELQQNSENNFLVSPFSAETVLALAQSGAKGETAEELRKSLHLPDDQKALEEAIRFLLPALKNDQNYSLHVANKMYIQENFQVHEAFKQVAADVFNVGLENINFAKNVEATNIINSWVEEVTNNKIHNLIDSNSVTVDTRVVLINALYFQANWSRSFIDTLTSEDDFYENGKNSVRVPTMHDYRNFYNFYQNEKLKAKFLEVPFRGEGVSMTFVLPNDREGLYSLEKQLEEVFIRPKYSKEFVNVSLPKFKTESTIDFKTVLQNLGVEKAFTPEANFGGITDERVSIQKIVQKTFINVAETGVEATGATYIDIVTRAGDSSRSTIIREFKADHPFIFFIKIKDLIIFVGRITSPNL